MVKPQVAPPPWALISFLASLLDMMHYKQGLMRRMGESKLWTLWDTDKFKKSTEYGQGSLQNSAAGDKLQAADCDARELSLVGEVPFTDQGHNMYEASDQYKAMGELLQFARDPLNTLDTMHQFIQTQ